MKLSIACDCGNTLTMELLNKKHFQLRDNLEIKRFHYDDAEIANGKLKEMRISCDNCKNWVTLGLD